MAIEQREAETFEQLNDPIPPFSERFERKMEKLLSAQKKWTWRFVKTPSRCLLTAVLVMIITTFLTLSVSAIGKAIFPYIVSFWRDTVGMEIAETKYRTEISEHYTLEKLPKNYVLYEDTRYEYFHITKWVYGEQDITLNQGTTENTDIHVSMKEGNHQYMTLRGVEMLYVNSHGSYTFVWVFLSKKNNMCNTCL